MYQSDHLRFCHLKINDKTVSQCCTIQIDSRLFRAYVKRFWTEPMFGTRESSQKMLWNVAKWLTRSGLQVQVSFICKYTPVVEY